MRWRLLLTILSTPALFCPTLPAQENLQFFAMSDVRAGLRGVGRTVFLGDKVEEFQVEILGVLKNAVAPKRDLILARLSGGPLEKTGVIAGMSGSPVYIDGKLVGAVSRSFQFSKEPLAGITPIDEMLEVVPEAASPAQEHPLTRLSYRVGRTTTDLSGPGRLIPDEEENPLTNWGKLRAAAGEGTVMTGLRLPLFMGGFSNEVVQASMPIFRALGFEPMQGGALSAGETAAPAKRDLAPGSMISLLLVRGDLNLNVDCTVTYLRGDNLYACGHQVLLTGPIQIPFAQSQVLATVPSIASSFKLDAPGPLVGTIRQDRFNAIYGVVGEQAPMIPVHVQVESTLNNKADYRIEIIEQPFLSPLLLNLSLGSMISVTERSIGPSTLEVKGKIRLSDGESVDIEDVVSADVGSPATAASVAATPLTYLLSGGFPDLRIKDIDLSFVSRNEKRLVTIEQVWSSKSEVDPGDHIVVTALLRNPSGEAVTQKIPVDIPASVSDRILSVAVGGGPSINALEFHFSPLGTPRDIRQLVRVLNRMRRNNRLYALLMAPQRSLILRGDEYPSPPPSLVQTFLADPAVASSIIFSGSSVVGDFETKPSPYVIDGLKTLLLRVSHKGT